MPILDRIRTALDRGELFMEYLPTVELDGGRCVGAEALLRWRRGQVIVPACEFMPLVENTTLSGTLTYWVIDTVAAELGEWLGANPEAQISINVPPEILGRGGIEYAARRSGLKARSGQIVLEITERGAPDRLGLDALQLMAERGVRIALDDVTLSGANLVLLTRCNFSMVKLSRALVADIRVDHPTPAWLECLRPLLRGCSLLVVAEGVETDFQARSLSSAGVQLAQGYLFSRPLPSREMMDFHAARPGGKKHSIDSVSGSEPHSPGGD
jgi:EAL domain-containing protein (putative c-di-GMP-specific phosphodiesterase class I)